MCLACHAGEATRLLKRRRYQRQQRARTAKVLTGLSKS